VADNVSLPLTGAGGTTATVATDEVSSAHYQYVKPAFGADGTATPVSTADPLPVTANAGTNLNTSALATESTLSTYTGNQRASAASNAGSQVSVSAASSTTLLASNASRKGLLLYFPSACWVKFGSTAANTNFLFPAGSVFDMLSGLIYTGVIEALSVSGTVTVHVAEW
jgi:hypothetical protein